MPAAQLRRLARDQFRRVDDVYRSCTAAMRVLPDFLIIGEAKCGTTALYDHINAHEFVLQAMEKEVHFFDLHYFRGLDWYRSQFPLMWRARRNGARRFLTGEASPYYMFHPHAPGRIKATLPGVKLIAMLRNPVERAYSHYQHEVRRQHETLSFAAAIDAEPGRLQGELERMIENPRYNSREHRWHAYATRGIYVDSLQKIMRLFDREQVLILRSEDYFAAPDATLNRVLDFLDLPRRQPSPVVRRNEGSYAAIDSRLRRRLVDFFAPHNARLSDFLGVDFGWN
jgi:hypothetical protein